MPPLHASLAVQALLSLQALVLLIYRHLPEVASHESVVQGLPSSQVVNDAGTQAPFWQPSPRLQALPSSQSKPSGLATHLPLLMSQLAVVQGSLPEQTLLAPGAQAPVLHVSLKVQALPSLQGAPSATATTAQPPVFRSQASLVQILPSSQTLRLPDAQLPDLHVSF